MRSIRQRLAIESREGILPLWSALSPSGLPCTGDTWTHWEPSKGPHRGWCTGTLSLLWGKAGRTGTAQGLWLLCIHSWREGGNGDGVRLFSVVPRARISGKGEKVKWVILSECQLILFHGKIDCALAQVAQGDSGIVISRDIQKSVKIVLGNFSSWICMASCTGPAMGFHQITSIGPFPHQPLWFCDIIS